MMNHMSCTLTTYATCFCAVYDLLLYWGARSMLMSIVTTNNQLKKKTFQLSVVR